MTKGTLCLLFAFLIAPCLSAEPDKEFSFDDALKHLGHDSYKVRVAAQEELRAWGKDREEEGIEVFYEIFRTHDDPEIRLRCRELLLELVRPVLGKGYIGVRMMDQPMMEQGEPARNVVRITEVMPGTPAEQVKLQVGDLVTGIDDLQFGQGIAIEAFSNYVKHKSPRQTVTLRLLRAGEPVEQKVQLMKRPPMNELFAPFGGNFIPREPELSEEEEFRIWLDERATAKTSPPKVAPEPLEN